MRDSVRPTVAAALVRLGADVSVARRRRRLTTAAAADLAGVARSTWVRIERGDAAVSLGVLGHALEALGLLGLLGDLVVPAADRPALELEVARLPGRVRRRRGEPWHHQSS